METEDVELELVRSYAKRLMSIVTEIREEADEISDLELNRWMHSMADFTASVVDDTSLLNREIYRTSEEAKEDEEAVRDELEYQRQVVSYYRSTRL